MTFLPKAPKCAVTVFASSTSHFRSTLTSPCPAGSRPRGMLFLVPLFQQLHQRQQRAIHRRRHTMRRALLRDVPVLVLDLGRLAAPEVLGGGGELAWNGLGDLRHRLDGI